jgi:hypothetical protein
MSTWKERLLSIFTNDQLDQVADVAERLKTQALQRKCEQRFTVSINERGHPRFIETNEVVKMVSPSNYQAE